MKYLVTAVLVAALAGGSCGLALAQSASDAQSYQQQQQAYQRALQDYKDSLAEYQRQRADYDQRYGAGSYDRVHGPPAVVPAPPTSYAKDVPAGPREFVSASCAHMGADPAWPGRKFAALAEAAVGPPAGDNTKGDGAVLGAVVGGTLGENLATSPTTDERYAPECDAQGYYYSVDQTFPYHERPGAGRGVNGRSDERYYTQQSCRLAVATVAAGSAGFTYRYARVCPDNRSRYRFTE